MSDLSFDSFSGRLDELFDVAPGAGAAPVPATAGMVGLTLRKVERLGTGLREGGSFSLIFTGPAAEPLPQATHGIRIGEDVQPIFLVPIGRKGDLLEYQAIFN